MALRDPRNKSRNNASRRTTSATRSKRSATSAKYNPKPSSSQSRSSKKGTGSNKVTTGKGGKVTSPRLRQALESVKIKRTPAKVPPKATQVGNQRVILEAFNRVVKQRTAQDKLDKAAKGTKGSTTRTATGSKPSTRAVKTNPTSSTPRGAQGPRTAPQQGPSQKVNTKGLIGSRPKPKPTTKPPAPPTQKYKPRVSNVGPQIRQARAVQQANPGRAARAARNANNITPANVAGALAGGLKGGVKGLAVGTAKKILDSSGTKGAAKMSRLGIGGNAPVTKPKPKPKPKKKPLPVDKKPIKAPPKKGSTVLAKKGGKEGVMRNGVFYATGWSPAQRNRYQIQQSKNKK